MRWATVWCLALLLAGCAPADDRDGAVPTTVQGEPVPTTANASPEPAAEPTSSTNSAPSTTTTTTQPDEGPGTESIAVTDRVTITVASLED